MSQKPPPRSPYLVSPLYDWAFFLLTPSIALVAGYLISGTAYSNHVFIVGDLETTWAELTLGTLIHAHLVAVVFRSHLNPSIFSLYPLRFVLVPLALWIGIVVSVWIAVVATVIATLWDVWHSGAQTFGFARIYDRNAGNPPELGRRLDYWLNQLLYAGPILAGATLLDHVDTFENFEDVGAVVFSEIPAYAAGHAGTITYVVVALGSLFLAVYAGAQVVLHRKGYRVSPLKTFLLVTTGLCSIYSWGFNSFGEAFFIMNLFHAVQYLALVWARESKSMAKRLRLPAQGRASGRALTAVVFFGSIFGYGMFAAMLSPDVTWMWAITMVVSLMHFWYDGFVWSVRKQQI